MVSFFLVWDSFSGGVVSLYAGLCSFSFALDSFSDGLVSLNGGLSSFLFVLVSFFLSWASFAVECFPFMQGCDLFMQEEAFCSAAANEFTCFVFGIPL